MMINYRNYESKNEMPLQRCRVRHRFRLGGSPVSQLRSRAPYFLVKDSANYLLLIQKKTYFQVISHRESRERILMDIHLLLEFTLYYIRPRQKMLMYLWISYAAILSKIDLFIMAQSVSTSYTISESDTHRSDIDRQVPGYAAQLDSNQDGSTSAATSSQTSAKVYAAKNA